MTTKLSRNARTLMQSYGDDGSSGEALRVIDSLTEEVKDLKARLKACRDYMDSDESWSEKAWAATDLRVKNWRKP